MLTQAEVALKEQETIYLGKEPQNKQTLQEKYLI